MFLRTVKAAGGKGVQHEYVRLVEAYREHGKNKQRIVCNLGRKDLLAAHLDSLIRVLHGPRRADEGPTAGEQSLVRAHERARPGALVRDGLRMRPTGTALGSKLARR